MKNKEQITAIKDFKTKEHFFKRIAKIINEQLNKKIYLPMFNILNVKPTIARNDLNVLIEALMKNKIYYAENGFKSRTGRFGNKISKELEKLGAKYSKFEKVYKISKERLPKELLVAVSTSQRLAEEKIKAIDKLLADIQGNIDRVVDDMVFNDEVEYIVDDVTGQIKFNIKKHINIIEPDLNKAQRIEIYKNYNKNMQFYIKNWLEERIPIMRKKVYDAILAGFREDYVEKMLINEYNIKENKAKFLAQNETSIMLAQLKKSMYQKMGFTHFIWNTILDSRERPEHGKMNGNIYSFDNPPVIYEYKGVTQVGLPGETYNCYSKDTEVLTSEGFKLIKDVNIGEKIASINPELKSFEWTICTNKVSKKVDKIYNIKNNIFDLSVSKDHTFFYYKRKTKGKIQIKGSEYPIFTTGVNSLARKNTYFYATNENWKGYEKETIFNLPIDIFCKFMGYYLSDGNVDKRTNNCIHIAQQDNEKMFNELKPYLHICQGKEKLYIYNKDLFELVAPLGYAKEKRIPEEIKNLPKEKIRIFLNAFASCDGRKEKILKGFKNTKELKSYNQYYTTSPKMMADLVECIYKTNMSCSVYTIQNKGKQIQFKNGTYTINNDLFVINEMKTKIRTLETAEIIEKDYNEYVYDIEVKNNHTILIKSGKSIHWNSNCRCSLTPIRKNSPFYSKTDIKTMQARQHYKEL